MSTINNMPTVPVIEMPDFDTVSTIQAEFEQALSAQDEFARTCEAFGSVDTYANIFDATKSYTEVNHRPAVQ